MRLGCLPLFPLAVSLKKMAHCITPFAGHRQSHSTAANESAQNKQCEVGRSDERVQLIETLRLKASEERNSNTPGAHLKVMTEEQPDSFEHAFQLSPSVTPTSPPLCPFPPPLPCFLALNSSVQAGQGLIVAQAHKRPYKGCVWDGKEAPGQADGLFIGIQSPWAAIHINCSILGSLPSKNKESGVKNPKSQPLLPPSMDNTGLNQMWPPPHHSNPNLNPQLVINKSGKVSKNREAKAQRNNLIKTERGKMKRERKGKKGGESEDRNFPVAERLNKILTI